MTNAIIEKINKQHIAELTKGKDLPSFRPGDTVRVNFRISEGGNDRIQAFEGVVIVIRNRGLSSSFLVRKISNNIGVERSFPLYSPRIDSLEVLRRGDVRRAKLYYLRDLEGKAARISEKRDFVAANSSAAAVARANEKKSAE